MSRTPEALINATLLVWARESIGLSLDDAAAKLKLPSERLAAWEAARAGRASRSCASSRGSTDGRWRSSFFLTHHEGSKRCVTFAGCRPAPLGSGRRTFTLPSGERTSSAT
jgi:hypothetical protein